MSYNKNKMLEEYKADVELRQRKIYFFIEVFGDSDVDAKTVDIMMAKWRKDKLKFFEEKYNCKADEGSLPENINPVADGEENIDYNLDKKTSELMEEAFCYINAASFSIDDDEVEDDDDDL